MRKLIDFEGAAVMGEENDLPCDVSAQSVELFSFEQQGPRETLESSSHKEPKNEAII